MNLDHPITVLGSGGWIGGAMVSHLRSQGRLVLPIDRTNLSSWLEKDDKQGPVIYTIGLTADFRHRPHSTVEAHVSFLSKVLQRPGIDNILYLSSTRVYARSTDMSETALLPCLSSEPSDLYNLSKLLGESLILQDSRPGLKIVRLSNVVGPKQPLSTFLGAVLKEIYETGAVIINQPADTAKNYVALSDVVRLLPMIAVSGQHRIYNLGSQRNTSHKEIGSWLENQGATVSFSSNESNGSMITFPPLSTERLTNEFGPVYDPFQQNSPSPIALN